MNINSFHIDILGKEFKVLNSREDIYLIVSAYSRIDEHKQVHILGHNIKLDNNRFMWEINDTTYAFENDRNIENEIKIERFLNNSNYDDLKSLLISKMNIQKYDL